ncbi:MAG TPA: phosphoribosylaminoimidazolesuccinocarboxamide synthase [bacterium]|nr:phosphoribosylaminoimidazolesuccinocarboxamide synthase [bacterium]HMW36703.1 phosphoribosylaminoimidazolesuccinocarboxamide synthase [bacterium]HMY35410.1 phosphoribosylaminoimidazolesuccinocarboxamide synthase [bacterium]HMZ04230.1 phosphoribosylaminoimidazolesuccinocarboxamide synthase [bacterium]HNB56022.1 phosphoribosylaminoimidazolesuccinocarboxamide synthase [bacterium]
MEVNIKKLEKEKIFLEGTIKKFYSTNNPDYLLMECKNDLVPMDTKKVMKARGKGQINTELTSYVFQFLESYHIPTHYVGKYDDKSLVVRNLEMIPIYVVVRNIAAGSFAKNFKMSEGDPLPAPIIEFYFKNDKMGNPMVNEYHLYAFGSANQDEVRTIQRLSGKVNAIVRNFFERRGFQLVDIKLEFGRQKGKIYLADELTLDTCRLWDINRGRKFDKEIAAAKENDLHKIYGEVRQTITHPKTRDERPTIHD